MASPNTTLTRTSSPLKSCFVLISVSTCIPRVRVADSVRMYACVSLHMYVFHSVSVIFHARYFSYFTNSFPHALFRLFSPFVRPSIHLSVSILFLSEWMCVSGCVFGCMEMDRLINGWMDVCVFR